MPWPHTQDGRARAQVVKKTRAALVTRVIPAAAVAEWRGRIEGMADDVERLVQARSHLPSPYPTLAAPQDHNPVRVQCSVPGEGSSAAAGSRGARQARVVTALACAPGQSTHSRTDEHLRPQCKHLTRQA